MTWLQRYYIWAYLRNSVWIPPVLATLAAIVAGRILDWFDMEKGWVSSVHADTARAVLGTMASALFTAIVFVGSALLVAVQLASAQLTPRIIAIVFRDSVTKASLTLFVFTFTLSLAALIRVKDTVPLLTANVASYSCLVNLGVLFYLLDHLGKTLRPSGALRAVAWLGRRVIENVYPQPFAEPRESTARETGPLLDKKVTATVRSPADGVVLAFDQEGLLLLAQNADCVIEMVPQVGDHVAAGDPLFRVYQSGSTFPLTALCHSIAVGQERTFEQDPAFAFRVMVDIASKALSPAINDPTTAVLALDEIHHLLRIVGGRSLDTGEVRDAAGRIRLLYRTPEWEDFVYLAVTEIRHFGGESIQVARRLHAMLDNLIQTLPEVRAPLLRQELTILHRCAERFFTEPEDRALAAVSDLQGVGGKPESMQPQSDGPSSPNTAREPLEKSLNR
jgi:uncharacterized membrane protein